MLKTSHKQQTTYVTHQNSSFKYSKYRNIKKKFKHCYDIKYILWLVT